MIGEEIYQEMYFRAFYTQAMNLLSFLRPFGDRLAAARGANAKEEVRKKLTSKLSTLKAIFTDFQDSKRIFPENKEREEAIKRLLARLDVLISGVGSLSYIHSTDITEFYRVSNYFGLSTSHKRKLSQDDSSFNEDRKLTVEEAEQQLGFVLNESRDKANVVYQYEDNDIQAILAARLQKLQAQNPGRFVKPIKPLAAVDNIVGVQLENRLRQEAKDSKGARILLIPCNLGNAHWVSMLLELDAAGKVQRAEYIDSFTDDPIIPETFQAQLQKIYPGARFQPRVLLKQSDYNSCGAYTIENLLIAALGIEPPKDKEAIRGLHLEILKEYNPVFYRGFNERQWNNRPTTAALQEQLGYLENLKNIWFSKQELNRILAIKKCLSELPEEIQSVLLEAFKFQPADEDAHVEHLDVIREALRKFLPAELKTLLELRELLFGISSQTEIIPLLENLKFQVSYNEILAVAQCQLASERIDFLQKNLSEQIKRDEEFAKQLQAKLWNDPEVSLEKSSLLQQLTPASSAELTEMLINLRDVKIPYKALCEAINSNDFAATKAAIRELGFQETQGIKIYRNNDDTLQEVLATANISPEMDNAIEEAMTENRQRMQQTGQTSLPPNDDEFGEWLVDKNNQENDEAWEETTSSAAASVNLHTAQTPFTPSNVSPNAPVSLTTSLAAAASRLAATLSDNSSNSPVVPPNTPGPSMTTAFTISQTTAPTLQSSVQETKKASNRDPNEKPRSSLGNDGK